MYTHIFTVYYFVILFELKKANCRSRICIITFEINIFNVRYLLADCLYLHEKGYEDPWLLFEAKRGPGAKKFGKHCSI